MLQLSTVQQSYGGTRILEIPRLELDHGIYWLQGPNGSGKTSLLRTLAGILPFTGTIRLRGSDLRREPVQYRRLIGWADAEPLYPDFLTGTDLLNFYRDIHRPPDGQIDGLIDRLAVSTWLSAKAASWSAGMTKKISLLLAFIGRASLVLLDEPLVTLDQDGMAALYALIRERHRNGVSFILSSHQDLPADQLPDVRKLLFTNRNIGLIN